MDNYARGEADRFSVLIDADFGAIAGRLKVWPALHPNVELCSSRAACIQEHRDAAP